jgi:hypothetical protein
MRGVPIGRRTLRHPCASPATTPAQCRGGPQRARRRSRNGGPSRAPGRPGAPDQRPDQPAAPRGFAASPPAAGAPPAGGRCGGRGPGPRSARGR